MKTILFKRSPAVGATLPLKVAKICYDKDMKKTIPKNSIVRLLLGTAFILLIPLVAMQFSEEVDWGVGDFIIIGTLLIGAGLIFELMKTRVNAKYRPILALIVFAAVLLIWVELAVGVFGSPFAGK
ncbi:MAG: hypothetical protein WD887_02430 [Candidatus Saccharimonadales bacterium]